MQNRLVEILRQQVTSMYQSHWTQINLERLFYTCCVSFYFQRRVLKGESAYQNLQVSALLEFMQNTNVIATLHLCPGRHNTSTDQVRITPRSKIISDFLASQRCYPHRSPVPCFTTFLLCPHLCPRFPLLFME